MPRSARADQRFQIGATREVRVLRAESGAALCANAERADAVSCCDPGDTTGGSALAAMSAARCAARRCSNVGLGSGSPCAGSGFTRSSGSSGLAVGGCVLGVRAVEVRAAGARTVAVRASAVSAAGVRVGVSAAEVGVGANAQCRSPAGSSVDVEGAATVVAAPSRFAPVLAFERGRTVAAAAVAARVAALVAAAFLAAALLDAAFASATAVWASSNGPSVTACFFARVRVTTLFAALWSALSARPLSAEFVWPSADSVGG